MIRPWYAFYPGDYANDTAHLSLTEHGAYRLLLDRYYMTGKPLQANAEQLLFVCRAFAKADADAVLRVLSEFFEIRRDGYHHKRADKELRKMGELSEKRREAGKIGAAVRQANAEQLPSNCLPQSHNTSTKKEDFKEDKSRSDTSVGSRSKSANRGQRWPADAIVPEDWIELGSEARAKNQLPPIDLKLEAQRFVNFWASKTGAGATKSDWKRTWINWALSPYAGGKTNGTGGRKSTVGDTLRAIARDIGEREARGE